MKYRTLCRIIGIAVTDSRFCGDLLNGKRFDVLDKFDLTDDEHSILMGIEAESLPEFAAQLEAQLQTGQQLQHASPI